MLKNVDEPEATHQKYGEVKISDLLRSRKLIVKFEKKK